MLAIAIISTLSLMVSAMPTTGASTYNCIEPESALALDQILTWATVDNVFNYTSVASDINADAKCVKSTLGFNLVHQMAQLESHLDTTGVSPANGLLEKRIRTCPEIEQGAVGGVSKYSCDSQPDPAKCRACATTSTAVLVAGVAACVAKANQETLVCCVSAASVFTQYYLHNCVHAF